MSPYISSHLLNVFERQSANRSVCSDLYLGRMTLRLCIDNLLVGFGRSRVASFLRQI